MGQAITAGCEAGTTGGGGVYIYIKTPGCPYHVTEGDDLGTHCIHDVALHPNDRPLRLVRGVQGGGTGLGCRVGPAGPNSYSELLRGSEPQRVLQVAKQVHIRLGVGVGVGVGNGNRRGSFYA